VEVASVLHHHHESLRMGAENISVHNWADLSCDITIMDMCSKIQAPHVLAKLHIQVRTRAYAALTQAAQALVGSRTRRYGCLPRSSLSFKLLCLEVQVSIHFPLLCACLRLFIFVFVCVCICLCDVGRIIFLPHFTSQRHTSQRYVSRPTVFQSD
jgi:hypothetical protein